MLDQQDLFTERDLERALEDLATIPFFPDESRGAVARGLAKMCPSRIALRWLVEEAVNHLDRWPGLAELRGILCTRFDAADGVEQWSSLPGYRFEDGEAKSIEQHEQRKLEANTSPLGPDSQELIKKLSAGVKSLLPSARSAS